MTMQHSRGSRAPLGPQARAVIDRELDRLTAVEHELRVLEGVHTHGAAFAAWLRLGDTAPEEPTCLVRFEECYGGAWERLDDLVTHLIDVLGWKEELAQLHAESSIPPGYLAWNEDALLARVHEDYSLVELDGVTFAFHR